MARTATSVSGMFHSECWHLLASGAQCARRANNYANKMPRCQQTGWDDFGQYKCKNTRLFGYFGHLPTLSKEELVPLAGIEPALLAESDFESDASTSSAIGATRRAL
jgi:hypothetical protein